MTWCTELTAEMWCRSFGLVLVKGDSSRKVEKNKHRPRNTGSPATVHLSLCSGHLPPHCQVLDVHLQHCPDGVHAVQQGHVCSEAAVCESQRPKALCRDTGDTSPNRRLERPRHGIHGHELGIRLPVLIAAHHARRAPSKLRAYVQRGLGA